MTGGMDDLSRAAAGPAPVVARYAERFGDLYRDEYPAVARYAYRLTGDADAAAEIAQEAFTRLLARWIGVREPRPYLYRVATNLARDRWASRTRELDARLLGVGVSAATADGPDFSVADAVDRLPARHRDVVLLHYFADLSVTDVAAALRRPAGTVKRLLSEARAELATALGDPRD
ncbi:MAG TPA: RNA polymerase sigma factor [Frankiaceae bacterium]|nr:RNA polymerase sigma factor [Frankiaceae bacterium]